MSFHDLSIPPSSSTVTLLPGLLTPVVPGYENLTCPVFAFLVENIATKQRVLFDLGPRKDLENAAPPIVQAVKAGLMFLPVSKDIIEQLAEVGVDAGSISAVIWSHSHSDHIGDMSKFPSSTDLVFGKNMVTETHESNPQSILLASDLAGRKLIPLDFDDNLEIGGFKAHDFFGDGSFYVLDVPGHQAGHVCGLARVTPTSFVFLGGDACHHAGVFRPTSKLHRHFPCPGELLAATRLSISPTHFPAPDSESVTSEFDLLSRTKPLLSIAKDGYFEDASSAETSIQKIGDFDANADVFVILGHDESLGPVIGPFPLLLDDWKVKGWKREATWAFLDEKNPAFRFKPANSTH